MVCSSWCPKIFICHSMYVLNRMRLMVRGETGSVIYRHVGEERRKECPGRRDLHPHLDVVCPHGPALVGQWELVRRRARSGASSDALRLSYGSRRRAANAHARRLSVAVTAAAPPERGGANVHRV